MLLANWSWFFHLLQQVIIPFTFHVDVGGCTEEKSLNKIVVSGMNGAIMVLPREGLKDEDGRPVTYDKAYYIGEQDFYVPKDENGDYKEYPAPIMGIP